MNRDIIKHYRSDVKDKKPNSNDIEYGEIAINYAKDSESLYIKNSNDEVINITEKSDLSNLVSYEEFSPVSTAALNSVSKGSLGLINGKSLEEGDVSLDLSLYKIMTALPTQNIEDNRIYLIYNKNSTDTQNKFDEYIYNTENESFELLGQFKSDIDLSGYLTTKEADNKYLAKSTNQNSALNVDNKGAVANFSDNGQAFLAVRPKGEKYLINSPYTAASFGVKDDGTAAFSHKTYSNYNSDTGTYTGAKNTAVLQFAGSVGLRYAKNSGSGNDVTDAMYKYVGVIDSPDEFQRVYSAKQVDDLLKTYTDEIAKLKQAIKDLGGTIE